jgi:hypothetical protein
MDDVTEATEDGATPLAEDFSPTARTTLQAPAEAWVV